MLRQGDTTSLAHEFQIDAVIITGLVSRDASRAEGLSALDGLLEGAAEGLEIARDDIDGNLDYSDLGTRIVIYATVPGGAGNAPRIGEGSARLSERRYGAWTRASAVRKHRATRAFGTTAISRITRTSAGDQRWACSDR